MQCLFKKSRKVTARQQVWLNTKQCYQTCAREPYTYSIDGTKLQKTVTDKTQTGKTITTITRYVNGLEFESRNTTPTAAADDYTNRLLHFGHEEGRVRVLYNPGAPPTIAGFAYDYFIKDHLGNVRMVLTDEVKEDVYPMATMETAQQATEETLYTNIDLTGFDKSNISGCAKNLRPV